MTGLQRFLGTETEYGIFTPDDPELSPLLTSTHAVVAYAALHTTARSRWDYEEEAPLKDARGFDLQRYRTVPVVDPNALGVANVVTVNGARFYVDHGHPEYSAPETSNAWDAMIYDAAGDYYLNEAAASVQQLWDEQVSVLRGHEPCPPLKLYKNNVDGKGQSYGSHENYLYSRHTDFDRLAAALIPFFVTRQVIIGAGRVGIGQRSERDGFQISQRADYFEQEISLETTLNRGIVNTRDEPHAFAERFRRLHVIVGDANMSQYSNYLKLGMTKLVLDAVESGIDFSDLQLADPVSDITRVSHDPTLSYELVFRNGQEMTAIAVLREYRQRCAQLAGKDDVDTHVLELWGEILDDLERDPLSTADRLDWTAKWALLKSYLDRGVALSDPKLKLIDIQYADMDPATSLYHALVRKNRMQTLVGEQELLRAVATPPGDTRAYFRGMTAQKFGADIIASSWQSVTFAVADQPVKISMDYVDSFTQTEVGAALAQSGSVAELVAALRTLG